MTTLVEQVATAISRFDSVADRVRERHLREFASYIGLLCTPVPERRPKAVRNAVDTHPTVHRDQRPIRKRSAARRLKDHLAFVDKRSAFKKGHSRRIQRPRCSRPLFILSAGTVQVRNLKSISGHVAKRTSPALPQ